MRFIIILVCLTLLSCSRSSKKDRDPTPTGNGPGGGNIEKPTDAETEKFFAEQVKSVYENRLENDDRVWIYKDGRRVVYRARVNISEQSPEQFPNPVFCEVEFAGTADQVRTETTEKFFTKTVTRRVKFTVDELLVKSANANNGLVECARYEEWVRSRTPYEEERVFSREYFPPDKAYELFGFDGENFNASAMSFEFLTTENNDQVNGDFDIRFYANTYIDRPDYFDVTLVSDDFASAIYDLGFRSCRNIKPISDLRYIEPMTWLGGSDADPRFLQSREEVDVILGHCYLVKVVDSDSTVFALFHVEQHEKSKRVIINEVEVLHIL